MDYDYDYLDLKHWIMIICQNNFGLQLWLQCNHNRNPKSDYKKSFMFLYSDANVVPILKEIWSKTCVPEYWGISRSPGPEYSGIATKLIQVAHWEWWYSDKPIILFHFLKLVYICIWYLKLIYAALFISVSAQGRPDNTKPIKCYQCNSFYDKGCADFFDNKTYPLIPCSGNTTMCRKIIQESKQ